MSKSCERKKKTHPRSLDRCVFQISLLFFQMMAATFGDRHAFFAERAFFRLVGRNGEVEQRIYLFLRYAEVCFAAASVYEEADADNVALGFIHDIDDFLDRAAGGDDVFDDQNFFTRSDLEAAAKGHLAIFSFGENGTNAQKTRSDLRQNDTASRRSNDGLDAHILEMICKFLAELFRIFRMLEHIEFFYIKRAVKTAGQKEMTFQNGFGFFQQRFDFFFVHYAFSFISFKIKRAAAQGSIACVIGRPITSMEEPSLKACDGVAIRF